MAIHNESPLAPFIRHQGAAVLDGGLATTLEARGFDLTDPLWSAKVLIEDPAAIRQVHDDFLAAGADCISTATYQASLPGFRARGLTEAEGIDLLRSAVHLAIEARDDFWSKSPDPAGRLEPLVAASIGPYGAFLADGSEYRGAYDIGEDRLRDFHRDRWTVLAGSEADLLACETIPSRPEACVLLELLRETPGCWAWLSFSCGDRTCISDGTPLAEVAAICDPEPRVAAVGINCVAPELVPSLVEEARRGTSKPILVYPNSGDAYDASRKSWVPRGSSVSWGELAVQWRGMGVAGLGGCCRVGPAEIAKMRGSALTSRGRI